MERPEFPRAIDSSMLSHFKSCKRKFELEYLHHWRPKGGNVHLIAGGAFAKGLEVARLSFWRDRDNARTAVGKGIAACIREYGTFEPPANSPKTCDNMCMALVEYFLRYGFETDTILPFRRESGHPAVEFTFAHPLHPELVHPVSGDPILYCGRFDMFGEFQERLWVVDEKTTTQLGPTWSNQWMHRSQFTGYCWAAQQYDYPVAGAIIRGISILKKSFGHAESIQSRAPWEIERWKFQTIRDIHTMINCWEEGYFDYNLDDACTSYGGCLFRDVCKSNKPERWLQTDFVKEVWNPLAKL